MIGAANVTADMMRHTFKTNVFGTVRVTRAFLPLLQRSAAPVVVNLSSGLASLTRVSDADTPTYAYPGVAYPASKTAVNMITVQYAKAFPNMRINAVEPGFTKTDLNGNTGVQTVEQGAEIIVRMAQVGPDGPPPEATSTPKAPFPGNPNGRHQMQGSTPTPPGIDGLGVEPSTARESGAWTWQCSHFPAERSPWLRT